MKLQLVTLLTAIGLGLMVDGATNAAVAVSSLEKSKYEEISPYMEQLPQYLQQRVINEIQAGIVMGTFAVIGLVGLAATDLSKKHPQKSSLILSKDPNLKRVDRNLEKEIACVGARGISGRNCK